MADLLNAEELAFVVNKMWEMRAAEQPTLDKYHSYWRGTQELPACIPNGVPTEVRNMAAMSRINVCRLVISVPAAQGIDPCAAEQHVVADAAIEPVVTRTAGKRVAVRGTRQRIVVLGPRHIVASGDNPLAWRAAGDDFLIGAECRETRRREHRKVIAVQHNIAAVWAAREFDFDLK